MCRREDRRRSEESFGRFLSIVPRVAAICSTTTVPVMYNTHWTAANLPLFPSRNYRIFELEQNIAERRLGTDLGFSVAVIDSRCSMT